MGSRSAEKRWEEAGNWLGESHSCRLLLGGLWGPLDTISPSAHHRDVPANSGEVQGICSPLPGGTCERRNGPWRESSADLQPPDRWGCAQPGSGATGGPEAVGVQGLCSHGSREPAAGLLPLVLQPVVFSLS